MREFWGNVPQVLKAYAWARAMGAEGIDEASDLSVLANNYMDERLARDPRPDPSHPHLNRLADGDDALGPGPAQGGDRGRHGRCRKPHGRLTASTLLDVSHEPWVVPEPFTPEAGEM